MKIHAGTCRAAKSLCGIIFRPGPTIRAVSADPSVHLVPAIVILVASILTSLAPSTTFLGGGVELDAQVGAAKVTGSALNQLAVITGIFLIGRAWGGNRRFKRALVLLSYCLVPSLLAGLALSLPAASLSTVSAPTEADRDAPTIAPEYQLYLGWALHNAVAVTFGVWTLLLYAKAIRVMNGFGIARTAALIALSVLIPYGTGLAHGMAVVLLTVPM